MQDNDTETKTLKHVDLENPTDGKKKDGCLKANVDLKICSFLWKEP